MLIITISLCVYYGVLHSNGYYSRFNRFTSGRNFIASSKRINNLRNYTPFRILPIHAKKVPKDQPEDSKKKIKKSPKIETSKSTAKSNTGSKTRRKDDNGAGNLEEKSNQINLDTDGFDEDLFNLDGSDDSEDIDMNELRRILDQVATSRSSGSAKGSPTPFTNGSPPKRGRPATKAAKPKSTTEGPKMDNLINEQELQKALRELESSEDFNFNVDLDDLLDEDAQMGLDLDLDMPDDDYLRAASEADPSGLSLPPSKRGSNGNGAGASASSISSNLDDEDDLDLDEDEEEEDLDEDEYLSAIDRRGGLLDVEMDEEDLLLDDVIGSSQLPALDDDDDDDDEEDDSDEEDLQGAKGWAEKSRPAAIVKSKSTSSLTAAPRKNKKKLSLDDEDGAKDPRLMDGKGEDFDAGIDPPPLEEFKRLMDSLGDTASMFEDEGFFSPEEDASFSRYAGPTPSYDSRAAVPKPRKTATKSPMNATQVSYGDSEGPTDSEEAEGDFDESSAEMDVLDVPLTPEEKGWYPNVYRGGEPDMSHVEEFAEAEEYLTAHDKPSSWRVKVISVVTNSSKNSTALEYVDKVYDYIKAGLNDSRVQFQTICLVRDGNQPFEEIEDMIHMWVESYNTYHLVDGAAMKEAWGAIMPHIMLSEKNLQAILDQVKWALAEDQFGGSILTPRLRRVRFRGGAQEMVSGFNTEFLDSEFSVVSVR